MIPATLALRRPAPWIVGLAGAVASPLAWARPDLELPPVVMGGAVLFLFGVPLLALLATRRGERLPGYALGLLAWFVMNWLYMRGMPLSASDSPMAHLAGRVLMFAVLVLGVAALRRWWRQRPGPGPGELSAG